VSPARPCGLPHPGAAEVKLHEPRPLPEAHEPIIGDPRRAQAQRLQVTQAPERRQGRVRGAFEREAPKRAPLKLGDGPGGDLGVAGAIFGLYPPVVPRRRAQAVNALPLGDDLPLEHELPTKRW
jgi:hypothetical protein